MKRCLTQSLGLSPIRPAILGASGWMTTWRRNGRIAPPAGSTLPRLWRLTALCWLYSLSLAQVQTTGGIKIHLQLGMGLVRSSAFSPNGRWLLLGGSDGTAHLLDVETGREIRHLGHNNLDVSAVAFSTDGRTALTADVSSVEAWDPSSGRNLRSFRAHSYSDGAARTRNTTADSISVSLDGRWLLTPGVNNNLMLWELATGRRIRFFAGHEDLVTAVALSPDGSKALSGSQDKTARVWDVATGSLLQTFRAHLGPVSFVGFTADGRGAITGSRDGRDRITLWDIATGQGLRTFGPASCASVSTDGEHLVTKDSDGSVHLWELSTGRELRRFQAGHWARYVGSVSISPDGSRIVATGGDESAPVRIWDANTGHELNHPESLPSYVSAVAFSPDSRYLVTGGGDKNAHLWDLATGSESLRFSGHAYYVSAIAFSSDGQTILTGSGDKTARLWETRTGREVRKLAGHASTVTSVALSSDGRLALTGSSYDKTARLWNVASGEQIRLTESTASVTSVAFSPDSRRMVVGTGKLDDTSYPAVARLIEVEGGSELQLLRGHSQQVCSAAFSSDGRWLVTGDGKGNGKVWDSTSWKEIRQVGGPGRRIGSAVVSPDGNRILTLSGCPNGISSDATASLWDVDTGREVRRFEAEAGITSFAYSPNGRWIATGSRDSTTRIWDVETGLWRASLISFGSGGWAVIDPAGRYDASDPDNPAGLYWVLADEVIELRQLKRRFYTPGLLGRILDGEDLPAVDGLERIQAPPKVRIEPPTIGGTTARVLVTNGGGGMGALQVKVNGREISLGPAERVTRPEAVQDEVSVDLSGATLNPLGDNRIEAFVTDAKGLVSSRGATANFRSGVLQTADPRLFVVAAGVNRYEDRSLDLHYAARDASYVAKAFQVAGRRLFPAGVEVFLLATGELREPWKAELQRAFAAVKAQARPQDALILYLAGHGLAWKDEYFFLTREARTANLADFGQDAELRNRTSVSGSELREWLAARGMPLKEVVVLDTCAAGAAASEFQKLGNLRDLPPDQARAIEFLKDSTGSHFLMGSTADAVSYEATQFGQGLLTHAMLTGMRGPALSEGGRIDVLGLFEYVQHEVPQLARGIGGVQKPLVTSPKGQSFPIGLVTAADIGEIPVENMKPIVLAVRCMTDDDLDPLGLENTLGQELRAASHATGRGVERIVYLDRVAEGIPGALQPVVRYTVRNGIFEGRLRVVIGGKVVARERDSVLPASDIPALARKLGAQLMEMIRD